MVFRTVREAHGEELNHEVQYRRCMGQVRYRWNLPSTKYATPSPDLSSIVWSNQIVMRIILRVDRECFHPSPYICYTCAIFSSISFTFTQNYFRIPHWLEHWNSNLESPHRCTERTHHYTIRSHFHLVYYSWFHCEKWCHLWKLTFNFVKYQSSSLYHDSESV